MKMFSRLVRVVVLLILSVASHRLQAATHDVIVDDDRFAPSALTIAVGDTVRWIFRESGHDTVNKSGSTYGNIWNSGPNRPVNSTFSFTFNSTGTFPYVCRPHEGRGMVG